VLFCCLWRNIETSCHKHFNVILILINVKVTSICIVPLLWLTPKALRYGSHNFTCKLYHTCLHLVSIHQTVSVVNRHLIAAYYSFVHPKRMKGKSWPGNKNKICPVNIIYSRVLYNNNIIIMSFINSTALCKIRCATGICLLHVDLHWLDVPERVQYKLGVTVRRCQQHKAPQYLTDCVTSASDIASRQRLRSASRHQLLVLRYQLSSLGCRSFAVAGPTTWISLSADLRDPACSDESFRRSLKTFLFAKY